jgi:hypothetical protein
MSEKINVVDRPPYKAWRVNFHDHNNSFRLVFSAVVDAHDRNAAWETSYKHYRELTLQYVTRIDREDRPPSEWEKPLP